MHIANVPIVSNQQVSDRYWHMVVDARDMVDEVKPGQFFHIRCDDDVYPFLRRPFSIYRINKSIGTMEFLYLVKGLGTNKLTEKKSGDKLDLFGPQGNGFMLSDDWDTIVLLARGVGIATLAALAQEATKRNMICIAILSARSKNDLLATETLQGFGAKIYQVTEEEGTSDVENVREIMEDIFSEHNVHCGFTCGSKRLSKLMQTMAKERNIPAQIAIEEHMGCAMGVCYACVCDVKTENDVEPLRVCVDGPVFALDKVVL